MPSKTYLREAARARRRLAANSQPAVEALNAIGDRYERRKAIRKAIIAHGGTKQTPSGPQYVRCGCERCAALLRELGEA